jgi:formylglycine-generating enzyme required for sulfatase activity
MCDCDPGFLADGLSCVVNRTGQDGGNDGGSDADHGEGKPPDSGPDGGGHEQPDIGPDRGDDGGERDGQLVTDGGDADVSSPLDAETDGTVSPNGSMEWVHIPGGTFLMGSDLLEDSEQPVHLVTVPSFEIARTEVTVAQYGECVAERRCATPATGSYCNWDLPGAADHPVNCVSWLEAAQFCAWADSRLPSEAEWEYAARSAGQHIIFPWGNEMATCEYAIMVEGGEGCGTGRTFPVCSRTAGNTAQGLCDMAGNLWEWVQDWYHDGYDGAPTDGSAWDDSGSVRVARGGAFTHEAIALRTAARAYNGPTAQNFIVGLRCAR